MAVVYLRSDTLTGIRTPLCRTQLRRGGPTERPPLKREKTIVRGRQALGTGLAVALTAGAAWVGISAATAGDEQGARGDRMEFRGWPAGKAAGSVAQSQRSSSADDVQTLIVAPVGVRAQDVDLGEAGWSAGDFFIFEETLYDSTGASKVGRDTVRCELGIRTFSCEATFKIDGRGKIRVAGALFAEWDNVVPVTGGTKEFKDVGGQLRVLEEGGETLLAFALVDLGHHHHS